MLSKIKLRLRVFKSLRVRIFIIISIIGLVPSLLMHYGILNNYEDRAVSLKISDVQNQCKILANHLIAYNYLLDQSSEVINAELAQLSNLYAGRVMIIDKNFKIVKDTYAIAEGKTMISEEIIKSYKGETLSHYDSQNQYIEITVPIVNTENSEMFGVMLTSISTDSIEDSIDILGRKAQILEISMSILIFAIAFAVSIALVKPFTRVINMLNKIKEGYHEDEVMVDDYLETELIMDAFNQVMRRMKMLNDSRQEFVANVSHELKTPITSMKVLADSLLDQEDVPAEIYKEFLQDIADEVDRENKIINDLLSLVKTDKKEAELQIAAININELMESILKRLRPIAAKRNIELVFESIRPVTAEIDEVKLSLAFSNLVENAIKYNVENGWVRVTLDADHKVFSVKVEDSGIGIPKDAEEHIFERFYRVEKSHSREIEGSGLGLAITRNAILLHRGAIKVKSEEEQGTAFTVKIPLNYIA